jgi:hypothetical protein
MMVEALSVARTTPSLTSRLRAIVTGAHSLTTSREQASRNKQRIRMG